MSKPSKTTRVRKTGKSYGQKVREGNMMYGPRPHRQHDKYYPKK